MKKLDEAQNTIEQFAAEEDAFEWDRTKYPLRSKLANTLTPYFTLYDLIVGYKTKYDKWLHGALTDVDPDQVKFIICKIQEFLTNLENWIFKGN